LLWIKVFKFQYHYQLGALDNFMCKWTDKEHLKDNMIGEIFIQLFKGSDVDTTVDSNKLLTFHIYPTTFLITIQGTHYLSWSIWEFSYLKSIVDHQFGTNATLNDENSLLDTLDYNDFVSVLDHSQTKPMSVSFPRIISPKNENVLDKHTKDNIISSLQVLEHKMCEISKLVDSRYESTNSYKKQEDIEKRQLILENRIDN